MRGKCALLGANTEGGGKSYPCRCKVLSVLELKKSSHPLSFARETTHIKEGEKRESGSSEYAGK